MAQRLLCLPVMKICAIALMILAIAPAKSTYESTPGETPIPSISEVQARAIAHARLEPEEISSWRKRAKLQALLAKLEVGYQRRARDIVAVDVNDNVYVGSAGVMVGPDEGKYGYNNDLGQNVEVRATWHLGEALFNRDSLAISTEARNLARDRQILLSEVSKNYYDRERFAGEIDFIKRDLRSEDADRATLKRELFMKEVALREATAALDAMTGGWFGKQID